MGEVVSIFLTKVPNITPKRYDSNIHPHSTSLQQQQQQQLTSPEGCVSSTTALAAVGHTRDSASLQVQEADLQLLSHHP